jgi:hypothetical protein
MERSNLPNALDLKENSALALQNGLALLRLPAHGKGERKNTGDTLEGIDLDTRIPLRYPELKSTLYPVIEKERGKEEHWRYYGGY